MKDRPVYPLVAPWILLALFTGLLGGLTRIGWSIPLTKFAGLHGLIMVGGFLGTVISFEKTITLKHKTWLVVPVISGLSVLFMIVGNYEISLGLQLAASFGLVIAFFKWLSMTNDHYYRIMIIGALSWMIAISGLMAGRAIPSILPWWIAFILFIIVGERLELSQFLPITKKSKSLLYIFLITFLAGIFTPYHMPGKYLLGLALIGIGIWLVRNDIVKISLNKNGKHQYIAVLLLIGYIWLIITGIITSALPNGGYIYDAMVHSFFLGFAFSMIFAHGPIIIPGILKKNYDLYSKSLYVWIIGFQITLLLRIIGDFTNIETLRLLGGLGNAIFILCFFGNIIVNVRIAAKK
jgi:hypothetical protein